MQRSQFSYHLPDDLIAQYPPENRGDSRLLCIDRKTGTYRDKQFSHLPELLQPDDLLIFNDTKVIAARLHGVKDTGGKVEILVERVIDEKKIVAQIRASKVPRPGTTIELEGGHRLVVQEKKEDFYFLTVTGELSIFNMLDQIGRVPLPPYIRREPDQADGDRYQTVFARHLGAVAAPTAGLHFSEDMIERVKQNYVSIGFVTLHIGAGTFQPVRSDDIENHRIHTEWFSIDSLVCKRIMEVKNSGGRIIAVGTTVVRCLESAAENGSLSPKTSETDIFIYPGYEFQLIDGLITNFHLPESTLLMLACAYGGTENILNAYRHATLEGYRFFSYGDAMFIA